MISINNKTKIYVLCPATVVAGGAELLHQLVDVLRKEGLACYVVYYDGPPGIPPQYAAYNIELAATVEDAPENVVVVHEGIFDRMRGFRSAQVVAWWMSVDNFFYCAKRYLAVTEYRRWRIGYGLLVYLFRWKKWVTNGEWYFRHNVTFAELRTRPTLHCAQSVYAQQFLLKNGINTVLPLSDYVNAEFCTEAVTERPKRRQILYNPKKGLRFTRRIIAAAPDLEFVPLINMSRDQLRLTFQECPLYIDFGYHPGKDRLPREAAINGCCVITNRQGSAAYFEDVGIPEKYKYDKSASVGEIVRGIRDVVDNYRDRIQDFAFYRRQVRSEPHTFVRQAKYIFTPYEA